MTEHEQREAVIAVAMTWLRTPYHTMGRVKGAGVDCGTLIIEVFSEARVIENFFPRYSPDWHLHRSEELYEQWVLDHARQIDAADIKRGDLMVWKFGRTLSHGAIYSGNNGIIHSYKGIGCVLGNVHDGMFVNRPFRCYRPKVWE